MFNVSSKFKFIFIFLLGVSPLVGAEAPSFADEIKSVEGLLAATKKTLEEQENLKGLLLAMREEEASVISGVNVSSSAARLVALATEVKKRIHDQRLEHLFSGPFLAEITFLTTLKAKEGIPKP